MKIVLLGYMASGKSAVGRKLAEHMDMPFIDLDHYIEAQEGMEISEIFTSKGEIYFRKIEAIYLNELISSENNAIISLGGGTPCYGNNMQLIIENNAISFYLKASIATIFNRLKHETAQRPLVAAIGEVNLEEYIAKHLFERTIFYEKATFTLLVNNKSIDEIVTEINLKLHENS
jgi:shikimate kinase